jgi:hypothetical protein
MYDTGAIRKGPFRDLHNHYLNQDTSMRIFLFGPISLFLFLDTQTMHIKSIVNAQQHSSDFLNGYLHYCVARRRATGDTQLGLLLVWSRDVARQGFHCSCIHTFKNHSLAGFESGSSAPEIRMSCRLRYAATASTADFPTSFVCNGVHTGLR